MKPNKVLHFHIITLFPGAFDSYLNESIIKRAIGEKRIRVSFYNPRDFTKDKWKRVDRRPYGGGPGMVLEAESIIRAAQKAIGKKDRKKIGIFFFHANGAQFNTALADRVAEKLEHLLLICGRYEGIDARVAQALKAKLISIGPYTLTGGELPALVALDAITRRLPGVLGKDASVEERRVAGRDVYTRPEIFVWKGKQYRVPKVLLSGDHQKIEEWKKLL